MNVFYVPALAGQIYAMPSMETQMNAVINQPGTYQGLSANYSGAGFSGMHFNFIGLDNAGFDQWVASAKAAGGTLQRADYLELEKPSQREPVRRYATVASDLYDAILNRCVDASHMCIAEMMAIDEAGGGKTARYKVGEGPLAGDQRRFVAAAACIPGSPEAGGLILSSKAQ
jgi:cytochrome o ubiquinol oxidase subunit 2